MNPIITLIQHEFRARIQKNPKYSLRAYARFLNIEPSALSKILRGKRAVSESMNRRFSARLGLISRDSQNAFEHELGAALHSSSKVSSVEELTHEIRLLSGELIQTFEQQKRPHILTVSFNPIRDSDARADIVSSHSLLKKIR